MIANLTNSSPLAAGRLRSVFAGNSMPQKEYNRNAGHWAKKLFKQIFPLAPSSEIARFVLI